MGILQDYSNTKSGELLKSANVSFVLQALDVILTSYKINSAYNADTAYQLSSDRDIDPNTDQSVLRYSQYHSLAGAPNTDWWSYITMLHGNTNGYFTQLASSFHSDHLFWRRKAAGTMYDWHQIVFADSNINFTGTITVPTPALP
jgi:hypothetical protein